MSLEDTERIVETVLLESEQGLDHSAVAAYLRTLVDSPGDGSEITLSAGRGRGHVAPPSQAEFEVNAERESPEGATVTQHRSRTGVARERDRHRVVYRVRRIVHQFLFGCTAIARIWSLAAK
ncbi:amphi-Trp domain-containing protein [Haloarcula amylolytica]|uniref:amphi-Trp domain-containing protein n=1 Tax=Haloarcula amylolytica TaxID=396317 RepID=UPI0009B5D17F